MEEKKHFVNSLIFPAVFLIIIWLSKFLEVSMEWSFVEGGVYPRHLSGLIGIITSPLIHSDWKHLIDNSLPIVILTLALFYFYKDISYKVFFLIYVISGILLWGIGRQAYHIGASGMIYGLATFLFTSGVLRKVRSLMAISLLVVFWYGSLVWGLLPYDYKVSFEAHLMGAITGIILAFIYRDQGPDPEIKVWDDEEDSEDESEGEGEGEGEGDDEDESESKSKGEEEDK